MIFDKYPLIAFGTSTVSDGNMSYITGNSQKEFANRTTFLSSLGIAPAATVSLKQIHSKKVIRVGRAEKGIGAIPGERIVEADGMITNCKDIFLLIKSADCNQIALFDPAHAAVGLLHAGRKGVESNIIAEAITLMKFFYKSLPKDLLVQFGPSIGPCHYPVDIWGEAEKQLRDSGVLQESIENPRICTYENLSYYSHARTKLTGEDEFRFATVFGMK